MSDKKMDPYIDKRLNKLDTQDWSISIYHNKSNNFIGLCVRDEDGFILDRTTHNLVIKGLSAFIDSISESEIEERNRLEYSLQLINDLEELAYIEASKERYRVLQGGICFILERKEGFKIYYVDNMNSNMMEKYEKRISKYLKEGFTLIRSIKSENSSKLAYDLREKFRKSKHSPNSSWYQLSPIDIEEIHRIPDDLLGIN